MSYLKKILVLVLFLCIIRPGHAQDLTIGTQLYEPPFESLANQSQSFFGFDIDLMLEICKRMKAKCTFKNFDFNDLFTGLQSGQIDLAISAITITEDRQRQFFFSLPYLSSKASFLSLNKSPLAHIRDIKGKTVGVVHGTVFRQLGESLFGKTVQFKEYKDNSDMMADLAKGSVDVVLIDAPFGQYWIANSQNLFKQVGKTIPVGYGYGIVTIPQKGNLIIKINQALEAMENDGTYLQIYSRYFDGD